MKKKINQNRKYYGTLLLDLKLPEIKGNYVIQLIDSKEQVIREHVIDKSETIYYEYLKPLKYKVKVIKDENGSGKWDTGNYLNKQQAEQVLYNAEQIQIRSNWDAEQVWDLRE